MNKFISITLFVVFISTLSSAQRLKGVNYGIYKPDGNCTEYADVLADFRIIATYASVVKIYSTIQCDGGENALRAANATGLKVMLGMQVAPPDWWGWEKTKLNELIQNFGWTSTFGICVGSEDIYRYGQNKSTGVNASVIINAVKEVQAIRDTFYGNIPVSHTDIVNDPGVLAVVDVVMVNIFPFWAGYSIENSLSKLASDYATVQALAPQKDVWLGEIGWPTGGYPIGPAVANPANAQTYLQGAACWAQNNDVMYFYFEAFDEPQKIVDAAGAIETNFGLYLGDHKTRKSIFDPSYKCSGQSTSKTNHFTGSTHSVTYQPIGTYASDACHAMYNGLACRTISENPSDLNATVLGNIVTYLCSEHPEYCGDLAAGAKYGSCNNAQRASWAMNQFYAQYSAEQGAGACYFDGYGKVEQSASPSSTVSSPNTPAAGTFGGDNGPNNRDQGSAVALSVGLLSVVVMAAVL